MTAITEGNLRISVPSDVTARKFDIGDTHGLTHCMKAVDLILEFKDHFLFIEIKDPEHPQANAMDRDTFIKKFQTGKIDEDLKYKYRDSFLYEWACGKIEKPIYYYVLIAIDGLTEADLQAKADDLKRKVPQCGPSSGIWKHWIVEDVMVFNLSTWNKHLKDFPIRRSIP
ncbi:MAG TPA: hypothetical protein PLQ35_14830 [bacterium]|nr:hypothetical protein [bacterium]HQL63559.1 hypothetical protein [bacterium]